jgi:hypothetical protein
MTSWSEFEADAPEFAVRARRLLESGRHRTLATIRADGSPRISGIECEIVDGRLRFGSMPGSRKGEDLLRDPRLALHGPTVDPIEGHEAEWPGEVKVSGRAVFAGAIDATDGPTGSWFEIEIREVVVTGLDEGATRLVIESWRPGRGVQRVERS